MSKMEISYEAHLEIVNNLKKQLKEIEEIAEGMSETLEAFQEAIEGEDQEKNLMLPYETTIRLLIAIKEKVDIVAKFIEWKQQKQITKP